MGKYIPARTLMDLIFLITMGHYFENKVEVIGFASPRIGKVLKFRGHEVSEEF